MIDTEHLLLGLLREEKSIQKWTLKADAATIRKRIENDVPIHDKTSTSIDLPLSDSAKTALHQAAIEADRLNHKHIGTEHLLLGLVSDRSTLAGKLLVEYGADAAKIRARLEAQPSQSGQTVFRRESYSSRSRGVLLNQTVEIHGLPRNLEYIRDVVTTIRSYNWHWHKTGWKPRDIVIHRSDGTFSFELGLAQDTKNFILVKKGWKKDHCVVCNWELFESEDEHGTGYTNGRSWLCMECCERFILRDFFSSSQSEMT